MDIFRFKDMFQNKGMKLPKRLLREWLEKYYLKFLKFKDTFCGKSSLKN
jgi:hypothetical protein